MEQQELIRQAGTGDETAFSRIAAEYETEIYNLMLRMTGSREDAFDLTLEVFRRAWNAIGLFPSGGEFSPWLSHIAANVLTDRLKHEKRRHGSAGRSDPDPGARSTGLPQEETPAFRQAASDALRTLPVPDRMALCFIIPDGSSFADAAQALDLDVSETEARIVRAGKALLGALYAGPGGDKSAGTDCEEYTDRMIRFLCGGCTDSEAADLDAHLAGCPECRDRYAQYQAVLDVLRQTEQPPEQLSGGVGRSIHGEPDHLRLKEILSRGKFTILAVVVVVVLALLARSGIALTAGSGTAEKSAEETEISSESALQADTAAEFRADIPETDSSASYDLRELLEAAGLSGTCRVVSGISAGEIAAQLPNARMLSLSGGVTVFRTDGESADSLQASGLTVTETFVLGDGDDVLLILTSEGGA